MIFTFFKGKLRYFPRFFLQYSKIQSPPEGGKLINIYIYCAIVPPIVSAPEALPLPLYCLSSEGLQGRESAASFLDRRGLRRVPRVVYSPPPAPPSLSEGLQRGAGKETARRGLFYFILSYKNGLYFQPY